SIQIWALRSRLEKQPTDLRRNSRDLGDGTLEAARRRPGNCGLRPFAFESAGNQKIDAFFFRRGYDGPGGPAFAPNDAGLARHFQAETSRCGTPLPFARLVLRRGSRQGCVQPLGEMRAAASTASVRGEIVIAAATRLIRGKSCVIFGAVGKPR